MAVKIGINTYQLEHRYLMEQCLGRKLVRDEVVHHINGDRTDNRLSNLVVLSEAEHHEIHRSMRRAQT